MILMLFHLFCMFDDYWRMDHRSLDSAGKSTVKIQYLRRSEIRSNQMETPILPDVGGSQKGRQMWATMGPHHTMPWLGHPLCRAGTWYGAPGPHLGLPFWPPHDLVK